MKRSCFKASHEAANDWFSPIRLFGYRHREIERERNILTAERPQTKIACHDLGMIMPSLRASAVGGENLRIDE